MSVLKTQSLDWVLNLIQTKIIFQDKSYLTIIDGIVFYLLILRKYQNVNENSARKGHLMWSKGVNFKNVHFMCHYIHICKNSIFSKSTVLNKSGCKKPCYLIKTKSIGSCRPKKCFCPFDVGYSPIFLLSKMWSYFDQLALL